MGATSVATKAVARIVETAITMLGAVFRKQKTGI